MLRGGGKPTWEFKTITAKPQSGDGRKQKEEKWGEKKEEKNKKEQK